MQSNSNNLTSISCLHTYKLICINVLLENRLYVISFCLNQTGDISTLNGNSLKRVNKFTYLGCSVSSTEISKCLIDTWLAYAWSAINRLPVIWKSDLTDKMKRSFFQAAVVLILLDGCTTWTLTKRMEKRLDGNYTRMLWAILNKSWRHHPTKQQLYGYLPLITKTIKVRRTRHAQHSWRSRYELIIDVLLWTSSHGRAKSGRPARTNIQQLCEDTVCSPKDLSEAMNDRESWQDRVRNIRTDGTTWWRWWWCLRTTIAIFSTLLNGFNCCNLRIIILFNIHHLFAKSEVVTSIAI